jgi:hypothetical protein
MEMKVFLHKKVLANIEYNFMESKNPCDYASQYYDIEEAWRYSFKLSIP